jgi:hypothetical protein
MKGIVKQMLGRYLNMKGRKEIFILILCILIGFALRFHAFDHKSLWLDEVHTFNDSRDNLRGHFNFYKTMPSYPHPPLFFVLTHLFYPFANPERDLRIIPLIFGSLSIPMIYLLARQFSVSIALPCALSLAFMTYHISFSQDGRSYSFLMFVAMAGLYFFMKHLKTSNKRYLPLVGLLFAILFYTSYSSIPFIILSQILWLYQADEECKRTKLSSFLILNGVVLFLCLPWIIFLATNYKGDRPIDLFYNEGTGSFLFILSGVFHDWVPYVPLTIASVFLLILLPFFSKDIRNDLILLILFLLPVGSLYVFCRLFHINHFVSSRYFISFLPFFLIILYLSLEAIELKFGKLKKLVRLKLLFVILFTLSNLMILPLYYRSEKQDVRGLVTYLKRNLQEGDKIFLEYDPLTTAVLHYFGAYPRYRHHPYTFKKISGNEIELQTPFVYRNRTFVIYHYKNCCNRYVADGSRLWIIVGKKTAKKFKESSPSVLKGYFDGSFLTISRFPVDGSLFLFLLDPKSSEEKGIDLPIE